MRTPLVEMHVSVTAPVKAAAGRGGSGAAVGGGAAVAVLAGPHLILVFAKCILASKNIVFG